MNHTTQLLVFIAITIVFILIANFWHKEAAMFRCKRCGRVDSKEVCKLHPGVCSLCRNVDTYTEYLRK